MATQGTPLVSPYELTTVDLVMALPFGDVNTPFEGVNPDGVDGVVRANAFPTPPIAWGFLTDVIDSWEIEGIEAPYHVGGALAPGGTYLEPNIGQIWPRIG
jgi:hypothetical protein